MYDPDRLKKLLQQSKDRQARRKEKERKKLQALREKLKRERNAKPKKKKSKKTTVEERRRTAMRNAAERELKGDKKAFHMVIITRNREKVATMGRSWWQTDAYELFNELIEQNQATVSYPVRVHLAKAKNGSGKNVAIRTNYEILLLQKTEEEPIPYYERNKQDKFIASVVVDDDTYNIIDKHEWLVEETFFVYGYNPVHDRKTFSFILNDIVLKDLGYGDARLVYQYHHRVIVQHDTDIDLVTCKSPKEAERLLDALQKECTGKAHVIFLGNVNKSRIAQWVLDKIEEKTGWERSKARENR